jgi:ribosome maturation factor RimP
MSEYYSQEAISVIQKIKQTVCPYLETEGFEIFDLNLRREGRQMALKLLIDRPFGGISVDECTVLNERISKILDSEDIIKESYILEVSSPGIDRPLNTKKDFVRVRGRKVRFILKEPIRGKIEIIAEVVNVEDDLIRIILDNDKIAVPLEKIAKAKQVVEL